MTDRPKLATKYHVEPHRGLVIDGETFPWHVALDPTWRVQPLDEHLHILWVPVMVDGGIPEYGEPDGDEIPCSHDWMLRPESDTSVCELCGAER